MGLDIHAFAAPKRFLNGNGTVKPELEEELIYGEKYEIGYWRNYWDLCKYIRRPLKSDDDTYVFEYKDLIGLARWMLLVEKDWAHEPEWLGRFDTWDLRFLIRAFWYVYIKRRKLVFLTSW